ncbi:uncharacterized protein LOC142348289 [Convolutriloba macropyga]|uniref:uncharacterized protein LOC142348289 n=1 Tax=Convolutriloba macropyga TaxID=536237 RepID=UPI003F528828
MTASLKTIFGATFVSSLCLLALVTTVNSAAVDASKSDPEKLDKNPVGSCHASDYIKCAVIIAGCSSSCSGQSDWYNCMLNCVIIQNKECIDCISEYSKHPTISLPDPNTVASSGNTSTAYVGGQMCSGPGWSCDCHPGNTCCWATCNQYLQCQCRCCHGTNCC